MLGEIKAFNKDFAHDDIELEYLTWKKHTPYLYDVVLTHQFDWPSLSVQWLPIRDMYATTRIITYSSPQDSDYSMHKLILGTNTEKVPKPPTKRLTTGHKQPPRREPNHLMIAKVP